MPHLRIREIMDELNALGMTPAHHALITELVAVCLGGMLLTPQPSAAAERQRRYRERNALRNGDVTCDAKEKVSHTLPKENNINNPQIASLSTPMKAKQAFKLPDDWEPSSQDLIWASQELGLGGEIVVFETEAFRDHFHSVAGPRARKRDWHRTWKNWMREAKRRSGRGRQNTTKQGFDRAFERIRNAARANDETNVVDLSEVRQRSEGFSGAPCDIEPSD